MARLSARALSIQYIRADVDDACPESVCEQRCICERVDGVENRSASICNGLMPLVFRFCVGSSATTPRKHREGRH